MPTVDRAALRRPTVADGSGTVGNEPDPTAKRREITIFLILAVVIWPVLAVAIVGGYGFLVWMYQLIAGPPGPPPV